MSASADGQGVSLTRANALTANERSGPTAEVAKSDGTKILSAGSQRELTAGLQSTDGPQLRVQPGGGARVQFAPGATLILVPASRAAPWAPTTQVVRPRSVRSPRTCGKGRSAAITQLAARALVLA